MLLRETTDANGLIYRGFLTTDTYVVEEVQAPVGYLMDSNNPQSIYIDETDDNKEYVLTFVNLRKPSIEIIKVDAENPNTMLQGAVFRVSEQGGNKSWDVTTGFDGRAVLENLEIGVTYIVEEKTAPAGYVNTGFKEAIVLNECRVHTVTVTNGLAPKLRIEKINEQSGNKLPGAVFRVSERGGMTYKDYTTGIDGTVTIENLTPGWYVVTEQRAPSGYVLDSTPREIEVVAGETAVISVNNNRKPNLTVVKIDSVTKQPLQYARFRISIKQGKTIGEFTTGADGRIFLDNIDPALYVIEEIAAPDGYTMLEGQKEILVEYGMNAVVEFPNQPVNPLLIKKVDAVTGEPLPGAKFLVTKVNGEAVGEYETGRNGYITVTGVDAGWYTVKEVKAPQGYILDESPKQVEIKLSAPGIVEFENQPLNGLRIVKTDATTREPLAGAKFRVTHKGGNLVGEYTSDANGEITIDGLQPGWYTITETAAPDGYVIGQASKDVEFVWGQLISVEFTNSRKSPLQILKTDADTGAPLSGARFRVTTVEGTLVGEYATDHSGLASVDDLTPGWYVVTELQAPDGYILSSAPRSVEVKANVPATVEVTNTKLAALQIRKTDAESGEPLPGAYFRVVTTEGTLIGEHITGPDGLIHIPGLTPGSYVVTETRCPDGYRLDPEPKTVGAKAGGTATVEFTNDRLPGLQVKKVDAVTGAPLAGARFAVEKMNGERVGEFVTNSAGFFAVPELDAGWYTVYEKQAPAGYLTDSTPQSAELKVNGTAVLEFQNKPLAGLQIQKLDDATSLPMAGVVFDVAVLNGRRIGSFTTDENGQIFMPDLSAGWLTVTEIKTLPGYKPDTAPRNVEILSGRLNTLVVRNQPYPYLQIKKIDAETGKPIPGVVFKAYDKHNRELGTFTTNDLGVILLTGMEAGTYYIRETKAAEGYVIDETDKEVTLYWGRTTTVEVKNTPMASLTVKKIDSLTDKPLSGAGFILYDSKGGIVGEYTTDKNGLISFPSSLPAGQYKLKEIKAPVGYVLPEKPVSITLKAGETQEIVVPNDPVRGKIQIVKKAAEASEVTKDKAGAALEGAVFEIVNEDLELVDTITTDERGMVSTIDLPPGRYAIQEITAPDFYVLDDSVFYAEIKLHGDVVKFEVLNTPADIGVTVEKRGNVEAVAGDVIRYDFSNISNTSNVALDEFYWHELLPTDAVRLETISTGTWNERVKYRVVYKTNLKGSYRVWKSNLLSTVDNTLDVASLNLAANEYITEFKLEFGTVEPGFRETEAPYILTRVLEGLPHEHRFVNKTDVGGKCGKEFVYATDEWVTVVFGTQDRGPLPRTGY